MLHCGAKRGGRRSLPGMTKHAYHPFRGKSSRIGWQPVAETLLLFFLAATLASAQFTAAAGSPVGAGWTPRAVAVGDLNGDGKTDSVTVNFNGNTVMVLLGNGAGTFTAGPGSPIPVGANPQWVAVGDFNGDGKPDLVIANFSGNNVTLLLGNGTGGFTNAAGSPFSVGSSPVFVAAADFNGDGKLDIVTANSGDNTITVLLGNGAGSFAAATGNPFAVGMNPQSIAVADFSKDGKLDLAVANANTNSVTVLLGDGTGGFAAATGSPFVVGLTPQSIAVGDLNGDGKPDIVTADRGNNSITVLLGNGTGGFAAAAGSPFATGTSPQSVALSDVNGDGTLDVIVANAGDNTLTVLLGTGSAGFTPAPGNPFAVGANPQSVAVADFNGDGQPDLVTANFNGNNATVLLNTLPALTLNFSSLTFYAAAGQAAQATLPVSVRSTTAGSTYTAASNQPWLVPAPTSNATGGVTTRKSVRKRSLFGGRRLYGDGSLFGAELFRRRDGRYTQRREPVRRDPGGPRQPVRAGSLRPQWQREILTATETSTSSSPIPVTPSRCFWAMEWEGSRRLQGAPSP